MRTFIFFLFLFGACFFQSCAQDRHLRLVILPDTQSYLESCPEIMEAQFQWLAEQASGIDYVLHVGDITQDNTHAEWALASVYFDLIHDRIPYAFSLGNHDFGSAPGKFADVRDSQLANKYFPLDKLKSNAPVEGAFEAGRVDNTYHVFDHNGQFWLWNSVRGMKCWNGPIPLWKTIPITWSFCSPMPTCTWETKGSQKAITGGRKLMV